MSGRRPFSELTKDFTPKRRQRIEAKKAESGLPCHCTSYGRHRLWLRTKIAAEFPEGEVAITNFSDVGRDEDFQDQN